MTELFTKSMNFKKDILRVAGTLSYCAIDTFSHWAQDLHKEAMLQGKVVQS